MKGVIVIKDPQLREEIEERFEDWLVCVSPLGDKLIEFYPAP